MFKEEKRYFDLIEDLRETIGVLNRDLAQFLNQQGHLRNKESFENVKKLKEEEINRCEAKLERLLSILPEFAFFHVNNPIDIKTLVEYLRVDPEEIWRTPLYQCLLRGIGKNNTCCAVQICFFATI